MAAGHGLCPCVARTPRRSRGRAPGVQRVELEDPRGVTLLLPALEPGDRAVHLLRDVEELLGHERRSPQRLDGSPIGDLPRAPPLHTRTPAMRLAVRLLVAMPLPWLRLCKSRPSCPSWR